MIFLLAFSIPTPTFERLIVRLASIFSDNVNDPFVKKAA